MEGSQSPTWTDSKDNQDIQASKKRKVAEKVVVTVKLKEHEGKQRNEAPPDDCWSWRKYGQKPIKGSPYPRGYYRCSTSKGCSAKKQVEICRTDASMLIITYTSTHNHPDPTLSKETKQSKTHVPDGSTPKPIQKNDDQKPDDSHSNYEDAATENDIFHYIRTPEEDLRLTINLDNTFFDEEPLVYPNLMESTTKSKENDFYDELEELPMFSSSYRSFMGSNIFEERVLVQPS